MTCEEIQSLLDELLFDLLEPETVHKVQQHLSHCSQCSAWWTKVKNDWQRLDSWTLEPMDTPAHHLFLEDYKLVSIAYARHKKRSFSGLLHWEQVINRVQTMRSTFCA